MKVLVVEDDPSVAHVMVRLIQSLGHEVEHLWSAEQAWEKFERVEAATQDIILSDNNTGGGITGLELLTRLRRNSSTAKQKFILTSGRDTLDGRPLRDLCREYGAEFQPKPLSRATLKKLLQ